MAKGTEKNIYIWSTLLWCGGSYDDVMKNTLDQFHFASLIYLHWMISLLSLFLSGSRDPFSELHSRAKSLLSHSLLFLSQISPIPLLPLRSQAPVVSRTLTMVMMTILKKPRGNGDNGHTLQVNNCKNWKQFSHVTGIPTCRLGKK